MYWADEFADQIIKSGKHKPYWVDDMKTPSGRVHIGSIRAVVTHELVYRALRDRGVDVTFSYVLEDHDPMDKLPSYLDEKKFSEHLGKPLYKVPSPESGYKSYGHRWGQEYIEIFNTIGVHPKIVWGSQLYLSGKMNDIVQICLDKTDKIRDIYKKLYGQKKPKNWFPFNVACEKCGKLSTTNVSGWDGKKVTYECKIDAVKWTQGCEHKGKTSPFSNKNRYAGKLPWKVEWACKWKVIGITIEGAGKDHMTAGGSHDFSKLICMNVINYPVPFHFSHEFFLIGGRKMSSSKGVGSSAKEIAKIIPPYLIRFMITKVRFNRAINFDPGGMTIPDLFDQYDEAALAFWDKKDEKLARIYELSQVEGKPPTKHFLSRFRDVARYIQHPEINVEKKFSELKGNSLTKLEKNVLKERIRYAQIWLEGYAPKEEIFTPSQELPEEATKLKSDQKKYLKSVVKLLNESWKSPQDLQQELYNLSKQMNLSAKEAFSSIYLALIGKNHGPKAAWLLLEHKKLAQYRFENIDKAKREQERVIKIKSTKTKLLSIQKDFAKTYPSATIGFALIEGIDVESKNPKLEKEIQEFVKANQGLTTQELGQTPEIKSYRKMYKKMEVDWHSRRPSPEALLRRIAQRKPSPSVNECVDAYNLIVMKYRVSAGSFDADKIKFPCQLRIAKGGEKAVYIGDKKETTLKPGEVAYFDQVSPYNNDYNYRDIQRTAVTEKTKNIWINCEGVYDITPQQVQKTLQETIYIILKYCGGKVKEQGILLASDVK